MPSFQVEPGESSFPNKLIPLIQLELEAALAHCLHVSMAQLCLMSKECLCFAMLECLLREAKLSGAGGWQRLSGAEQLSLWKLGCLRQAVLCCVQHRNNMSSMRGGTGLQPFVICCKWCQRLWLKISGWLDRQLVD